VAARNSMAAGLGAERSGGDGRVSRQWRESFSAALDRRQVGGGSESPGTAGVLGARPPRRARWRELEGRGGCLGGRGRWCGSF
jgi:hypothetical protein